MVPDFVLLERHFPRELCWCLLVWGQACDAPGAQSRGRRSRGRAARPARGTAQTPRRPARAPPRCPPLWPPPPRSSCRTRSAPAPLKARVESNLSDCALTSFYKLQVETMATGLTGSAALGHLAHIHLRTGQHRPKRRPSLLSITDTRLRALRPWRQPQRRPHVHKPAKRCTTPRLSAQQTRGGGEASPGGLCLALRVVEDDVHGLQAHHRAVHLYRLLLVQGPRRVCLQSAPVTGLLIDSPPGRGGRRSDVQKTGRSAGRSPPNRLEQAVGLQCAVTAV